MRGLLRDTFRRAVAGRALHVMVIVAILACLGMLGAARMEFDFEMHTSGFEVEGFEDGFENGFENGFESIFEFLLKGLATFLLFVPVMASAGVFPSKLAGGTAEFYLSHPLTRNSFYFRSTIAFWIVYGGAAICCLFAVAAMTAISFGVFPAATPYLALLLLFRLAVWLCFTSLVSILSGSATFTIISSFILWFTQVYLARWRGGWSGIADSVFGRKAVFIATDILYWILPKEPEIVEIFETFADGGTAGSWTPLYTTILSAAAMAWLAMFVLRRKDF